MEYTDSEYIESANKKTVIILAIIYGIFSIAYVFEYVKGDREIWYVLMLLGLAWVPFFLLLLIVKIKGWSYKRLKSMIAFFFGTLYATVMFTTNSPYTAFAYILPLTCMLVIYKNVFFLIRVGIVSLVILFTSTFYNVHFGNYSVENLGHVYSIIEMQVFCVVMCYVGYVLVIKHLSRTEGTMLGVLQEHLSQVVTTIAQVKKASAALVDDATILRELADENKRSASDVLDDLDALLIRNSAMSRSVSSLREAHRDNPEARMIIDQLSREMDTMDIRINDLDDSINNVINKYKGTIQNVNEIESIVERLMQDLGNGGFMQLKDVNKGMKLTMIPDNGEDKELEFLSEVIASTDDTLYIMAEGKGQALNTSRFRPVLYELRITVRNVLYVWKNLRPSKSEYNGKECYKLKIEEKPKVLNRRKFSRIPLDNGCRITMDAGEHVYDCEMIDISANGFAFACYDNDFENYKNKECILEIFNFPLLDNVLIKGEIIRIMLENGKYIIGCRMPEDRKDVMEYVNDYWGSY